VIKSGEIIRFTGHVMMDLTALGNDDAPATEKR